MQIRHVMNTRVVKITPTTTLKHAAELVTLTQASDLMVVDDEDLFIGVLSEGDLIRAVIPDFHEIVSRGGSLQNAYDFLLENGRYLADQPIHSLIVKNAITVSPGDDLLKASTVMTEKQIRRLPVVTDQGKLVATVSRADICWGILSGNALAEVII